MNISQNNSIAVNSRGAKGQGGVSSWASNVIVELEALINLRHVEYFGEKSKSSLVRRLAENLTLPISLQRKELLFSPCNWGPMRVRQSLVVHDIAPLIHPQYFSRNYRISSRILTKALCKKVDQILTVSHFTAKELIDKLDIDQSKIRVVGASIPKLIFNSSEDYSSLILNEVGTRRRTFLFIGSHDKRKNLDFLLDIWIEHKKNYDDALIIVGRTGINQLIPTIKRDLPGTFWHWNLNDSTLRELIKKVDCLLSPSIYEGYGFPIVEALSLGTEVISSPTGIALELSQPGLAKLYFDQQNWLDQLSLEKKSNPSYIHKNWRTVANDCLKAFEEIL
jgi:glycosyltransferase involved in cell wall biosynthesis